MTDLIKDTVTYLSSKSDLTMLLGQDSVWPTWIFPNRNFATNENSETTGLIVRRAGNWTEPNLDNTARFPRIRIDIISDPTRNSDGSVNTFDAEDKIDAVFQVLNKYLHILKKPTNGIFFATTRILDSKSLGEPDISRISDSGGAYVGQAFYALSL